MASCFHSDDKTMVNIKMKSNDKLDTNYLISILKLYPNYKTIIFTIQNMNRVCYSFDRDVESLENFFIDKHVIFNVYSTYVNTKTRHNLPLTNSFAKVLRQCSSITVEYAEAQMENASQLAYFLYDSLSKTNEVIIIYKKYDKGYALNIALRVLCDIKTHITTDDRIIVSFTKRKIMIPEEITSYDFTNLTVSEDRSYISEAKLRRAFREMQIDLVTVRPLSVYTFLSYFKGFTNYNKIVINIFNHRTLKFSFQDSENYAEMQKLFKDKCLDINIICTTDNNCKQNLPFTSNFMKSVCSVSDRIRISDDYNLIEDANSATCILSSALTYDNSLTISYPKNGKPQLKSHFMKWLKFLEETEMIRNFAKFVKPYDKIIAPVNLDIAVNSAYQSNSTQLLSFLRAHPNFKNINMKIIPSCGFMYSFSDTNDYEEIREYFKGKSIEIRIEKNWLDKTNQYLPLPDQFISEILSACKMITIIDDYNLLKDYKSGAISFSKALTIDNRIVISFPKRITSSPLNSEFSKLVEAEFYRAEDTPYRHQIVYKKRITYECMEDEEFLSKLERRAEIVEVFEKSKEFENLKNSTTHNYILYLAGIIPAVHVTHTTKKVKVEYSLKD